MPDVVALAQNITVKLPTVGIIVDQPVDEAFDASPYTGFRLQPVLLTQNPAGAAAGFNVEILTSMTKDSDDGSWQPAGNVDILGLITLPEWKELQNS